MDLTDKRLGEVIRGRKICLDDDQRIIDECLAEQERRKKATERVLLDAGDTFKKISGGRFKLENSTIKYYLSCKDMDQILSFYTAWKARQSV